MPVRPVCVLELKPTILEQPVADKHSFKNESHREVDIVAVSLAAAIVTSDIMKVKSRKPPPPLPPQALHRVAYVGR